MIRSLIVATALVGMTGCTDAGIGKITSLGASATVECWSGGKLMARVSIASASSSMMTPFVALVVVNPMIGKPSRCSASMFKGKSTGKVLSEENSDGYFFRDAADGKFKEVSGNCVIGYGD